MNKLSIKTFPYTGRADDIVEFATYLFKVPDPAYSDIFEKLRVQNCMRYSINGNWFCEYNGDKYSGFSKDDKPTEENLFYPDSHFFDYGIIKGRYAPHVNGKPFFNDFIPYSFLDDKITNLLAHVMYRIEHQTEEWVTTAHLLIKYYDRKNLETIANVFSFLLLKKYGLYEDEYYENLKL